MHPSSPSPQNTDLIKRKPNWRRWRYLLFGSAFIIAGVTVMGVIFIYPHLKRMEAQGWESVPCVIESSGVTSTSGRISHAIQISYRYRYQDVERVGDRYNFFPMNSPDREWRDRAVAEHPPGSKTMCWVNPKKPAESVINREVPYESGSWIHPSVFMIVGTSVAVLGGRKPRKVW